MGDSVPCYGALEIVGLLLLLLLLLIYKRHIASVIARWTAGIAITIIARWCHRIDCAVPKVSISAIFCHFHFLRIMT